MDMIMKKISKVVLSKEEKRKRTASVNKVNSGKKLNKGWFRLGRKGSGGLPDCTELTRGSRYM
jgi:hypothetical protein